MGFLPHPERPEQHSCIPSKSVTYLVFLEFNDLKHLVGVLKTGRHERKRGMHDKLRRVGSQAACGFLGPRGTTATLLCMGTPTDRRGSLLSDRRVYARGTVLSLLTGCAGSLRG